MRRKELRNSKLGAARPDGWSTLHFAAKEGNLRVVEDIMQHGSGDLVRLKAPDGSTPLHIAVLHGHITVVEYLLRHHDTEVNARSQDGTPLDIAHNNRRKRLVAILSAAGGETHKYDPLSNLRASTGVQL
jgi:ankyrin repeat protein